MGLLLAPHLHSLGDDFSWQGMLAGDHRLELISTSSSLQEAFERLERRNHKHTIEKENFANKML